MSEHILTMIIILWISCGAITICYIEKKEDLDKSWETRRRSKGDE